MFGIENYPGFILAAVILNLTPGADTLYILTRSISMGLKAGLVSVGGIISGCVVHVLCAAFGLSVVLAASATLFNLVKWTGAVYLIYLGIKTFVKPHEPLDTEYKTNGSSSLLKIYKQGVLTNVLNPKVALFFLSFLPQFISPENASGALPFLILGATFLVTGTIWCLILCWAASLMTRTLQSNPLIEKVLIKLSGMVFIGFGLKLAFTKQH